VDSVTAAALEEDERFILLPRPAEDVRGFGEILPVELQRGRGRGLVLD
jgi:adenylate cyclase